MTRERPTGIYVVGLVMVLGALWGLVQGFFGGLAGILSLGALEGWGLILTIVSTFLFFVSLGKLVVAYGLMTFQSWGWTWTMAIVGLDLVIDTVTLLSGNVGSVIGVGISGIVLAYVFAQRRHFKTATNRNIPEANRT